MCTATMSGFVGDLSDQQAADLASVRPQQTTPPMPSARGMRWDPPLTPL